MTVSCEVDNVFATVEIRVHSSILATMDSFVIFILDVLTRLAYASTGLDILFVELDPRQRGLLGITESLHMCASSRLNSNSDLYWNDGTSGTTTVEAADVSVNERNYDRQILITTVISDSVHEII